MSGRSKTVYVVTDKGTGEQSAWSRKLYAIAEVHAVANARYESVTDAVGHHVYFSAYPRLICELPIDSESMAYGKDWKDKQEFAEARQAIDKSRKTGKTKARVR